MKRSGKIVGLDMLPAYPHPGSGQVAHLLDYFCDLLRHQLADCHYVELPSIHQLAQYFRCSYLFFYDVLRQLNGAGFDYSFSSLDGALQVWVKE